LTLLLFITLKGFRADQKTALTGSQRESKFAQIVATSQALMKLSRALFFFSFVVTASGCLPAATTQNSRMKPVCTIEANLLTSGK
jgi:hypothetical protein